MGQSSAELESGENTHAVRAVAPESDIKSKHKVSGKRAKRMQLVSNDSQQKDDSQSFFTPPPVESESESEIVNEDLVESVLSEIDLDQMIDSLSVPELLSPLSSILSESGYDSCSSPAAAADQSLSSDSDSLTDLFPDLAYDHLLLG